MCQQPQLFRFYQCLKAHLCIKLVPLVAAKFLDSYNRNGEERLFEVSLLKVLKGDQPKIHADLRI